MSKRGQEIDISSQDLIKSEIEFQYIHTWLAKKSKLTSLGIFIHKGLDLFFAQPAGGRQPVDLIQRRSNADMRIQSTAG